MQFQVPQFIETEDKLVGPFTLRQFMYLAVFGSITFLLFFLLKTGIWFICAIFLVGLGLLFAFGKIEGRDFGSVFLSAISYFWNPQTYVWQPENKITTTTPIPTAIPTPSVERIVQGISLKKAWRSVQTGSSAERKPDTRPPVTIERYQVFRGITGENRAAKRVDYR